MNKKRFTPSTTHIEVPNEETLQQMRHLTPEQRKKIEEAVKPTLEREKQLKKYARRKWLASNWIPLLGLIFSAIAAFPVIWQGIETMLKLLG